MQVNLFGSQHPEVTEKEKVLNSLDDLTWNMDNLRQVFTSLRELLHRDLLTTAECQLKADKAIDDFIAYVNSGGLK